MKTSYFVAIDFDGTVTDCDIIDAVLQEFAGPEWRDVEALWEKNIIGSRECLQRQMAMIDQPLDVLLYYVDRFSIDSTFGAFLRSLERRHIPFAIVSDGFEVFIERLLANAGIRKIPVYANILREGPGGLETVFPFSHVDCNSANCKCNAVKESGRERSLIVVGDGRSDYCLARRAVHVFSKKKLTTYCEAHAIPHTPFQSFAKIDQYFDRQPVSTPFPLSVLLGEQRL